MEVRPLDRVVGEADLLDLFEVEQSLAIGAERVQRIT